MIQREIQESAYRAQLAIDAGESVVVGVNKFATSGQQSIDVLRIDPEIESRQVDRVRHVRASRDHSPGGRRSTRLVSRHAARTTSSRSIIQAVEAHATSARSRTHCDRCSGSTPRSMSEAPLLGVEHLTTGFEVNGRFTPAVIDLSFSIAPGETLGLVGESGSGKSLTAFSIMRLVERPGRIESGRILYKGRDLRGLSEREMQDVRGGEIALIFQEPMTALNPVFTIGNQIEETLLVHGRATRRTARARALELLEAVSIPDPARRIREYPHQLSGGLRQRALIAISLACNPSLVIADEPTTALDVTIQAQILDLLRDLRAPHGPVATPDHPRSRGRRRDG